MFRRAVFRLTFWYALVICVLSLFFSVALYTGSTRELDALQARQESLLQGNGVFILPPAFSDLNRQRIEQIEEAKQHIAWRLAYFNLIIILAGTGIAYLLAKRTLQPIEESVRTQDRFAADASHELRTPLTAMKTELEVALRDKGLTLAESKSLHKSTLQEIAKLEVLTDGLLKLAKQNGDALAFQKVSLTLVLEEAIGRVAAIAKQRHITIENEVADFSLLGDQWSLTELFSILLDNAIKYSPEGKMVWIKAKEERHQVIVLVKDEGMGIAEADIPHIFDRFYRSDISRSKENVEGYGLGLSIAKQIVDSHKGSISVSSKLDVGSSFAVRLPLFTHKKL